MLMFWTLKLSFGVDILAYDDFFYFGYFFTKLGNFFQSLGHPDSIYIFSWRGKDNQGATFGQSSAASCLSDHTIPSFSPIGWTQWPPGWILWPSGLVTLYIRHERGIAIREKMNGQNGTEWDGTRLNDNSIGFENTIDYCLWMVNEILL